MILWFVLDDRGASLKKKLVRIGLIWSAYLGLLAAFAVWRLLLNPFPGRSLLIQNPDSTNPLVDLFDLATVILLDQVDT